MSAKPNGSHRHEGRCVSGALVTDAEALGRLGWAQMRTEHREVLSGDGSARPPLGAGSSPIGKGQDFCAPPAPVNVIRIRYIMGNKRYQKVGPAWYPFRNRISPLALTTVVSAASFVVVALVAITFHEAAHAYAAAACGDDTARRLGRTSLNPIRHIDLFGTILLPALLYMLHAPFLIGWAKPVPIDWSKLRHWKRDMALVAAAGPAANFALAGGSYLALTRLGGAPAWIGEVLGLSLLLNLTLGVLNLIPIPPLDGSKVLAGFLSDKWALKLAGFRRVQAPVKWFPDNRRGDNRTDSG